MNNPFMNIELASKCILQCATRGLMRNEVKEWVKDLGLDENLNRSETIEFLRQYNHWSTIELWSETDTTLAARCLWIECLDRVLEARIA